MAKFNHGVAMVNPWQNLKSNNKKIENIMPVSDNGEDGPTRPTPKAAVRAREQQSWQAGLAAGAGKGGRGRW